VNKNNMAIPQEVADKVQQKLAEARDGTKLVSTVDAVLKILQAHSLAWRQTILPPHVGVHQMNRDGLGLNSSEVHALIDDVLSVGFARDEVRGVCFEVQHSNEATRKFNEKMVAESGGNLAPLDAASIRYASVAGSHLNAGLNCWLQSIKHQGQPLSLARLQEIDAEYYKACMEGTSWLVVSSQVESKWPELPGMIQAANNTASHLSRTESELQLLRKIWHCTVAKQEGSKVSLCWGDIASMVLRTKPTLGQSGPFLFNFIVKFSGGVKGAFLEDTLNYIKAHGYAQRTVGAEVYELLAQDIKGTEQHAIYRHCIQAD